MSGPEVSPSQAPAPATAAEARDSTPSRDDGIPIMPVTSASGAPGPAGAPIRPLPRPSDFGHSGGGRGPNKSGKGGGRLGARPVVFRSTWQEVSFVFMATAATMTSSFLTGATTIITASIGRDLGMTQGQMTWITASAALSAGAVQLALGQLADLLGRKATLTSGLAAFAVLAVVTGFARDPYWMDVFCGLLGVCSALVVPPAIGIMGAAYDRPSRRKNLAFSAFSAGNPLGFVFGSIASGVAARLFNWRAVFYLLGILWAALAVFALWAVPRVEAFGHRQGEEEGEGGGGGGSKKFTVRRRLVVFMRTFDWVGAVFTLFGTGLFAAAVTLGPADGWKSAHVIAMLVIGISLLVLFVFWENFYEHPLMPPHIWKDRNFSLLIIVMVFGFMAFNSGAFWLSLYMQQVLRFDALTVALHLLPQCIAGLIWNIVAGSLLHRVNNTILMAVGAVSYFAASLLLSFNKLDSSYWAFFFPSLVLMVVGADFQFNVANMYVMQSLPSHKQGLAGGIFNTTIKLATTVALGVSTAVYSSVERTTEGMEDPVVKYTRAWQVSIAFSAVGLLAVPFLRIGTQGNATHDDDDNGDPMEATGLSELEPSAVKTSEKKRTDMA